MADTAATATRTTMSTDYGDALARARLLQLLSPNLPLGAFSYSQGLEWATETGWVHDQKSLQSWLGDQLLGQLQQQELPMLAHCHAAGQAGDFNRLEALGHELLAFRETAELRAEETNRGRAMAQVLIALGVPEAEQRRAVLQQCQHAGFAWACVQWQISLDDALLGFAWSWLENAVLAAVKLVPLGQSSGQQVLFELGTLLPAVADGARRVPEADIGYASTAVSYASSAHETQYTRLYRS